MPSFYWALNNICGKAPIPEYEKIKTVIPVLCKAIVSGQLSDK